MRSGSFKGALTNWNSQIINLDSGIFPKKESMKRFNCKLKRIDDRTSNKLTKCKGVMLESVKMCLLSRINPNKKSAMSGA
ncbi:MAG: hypothetical protein DWQ10_12815 [Calditrichaeota bacterium]|nr:MAG: hypothetical protein DWQ10_12815 [Calditrichota bacterium]